VEDGGACRKADFYPLLSDKMLDAPGKTGKD
jgi:hypothetical protein